METLVEDKTLYTRCPTCSTAFKVTDELLALANGKVRCGACLAIFQATDYMLERSKKPSLATPVSSKPIVTNPVTANPITPKSIEPSPASTTPIRSETNYLQQNASEPESIQSKTTLAETTQKKTEISEPDDFTDDISIADPEVAEIESIPESISVEEFPEDMFAEDLLDDNLPETQLPEDTLEADLELTGLNKIEPKVDPTLSEKDFEEKVELSNFDDELEQTLIEEPSIEEDDLSFDEVDELEGESFNYAEEEAELEESAEYNEENYEEDRYDEQPDYEDQLEYEEDSLDYQEEIIESNEFEPDTGTFDELSDQLSEQMQETDYEPDPLDEFDEMVAGNRSGIKSKLITLSILILLGVGLFSVWSNRQSLAWSDTWGETVTSVCAYLPCDLKPKRDVSKIKLLQRQLAPDEELENVLDVKVLLINEATFAQPYPTIKIAFSNKDGKQVLVKGFKPSDYLDAGSVNDLMPSESEVHIHFKTEVEGSDSLGFEFIFE